MCLMRNMHNLIYYFSGMRRHVINIQIVDTKDRVFSLTL